MQYCSLLVFLFRPLFHTVQLMLPESLECPRPFVQRPDGLGIRLIKFAAAIAAHLNKADVSQDPQMLRYGRLLKAQRIHDVADSSFAKREKI
jgi:hypothetical protein